MGKGKSWTVQEDEQLCASWLEVSSESKKLCTTKGERMKGFWLRVVDNFQKRLLNAPPPTTCDTASSYSRTARGLQQRWSLISQEVHAFGKHYKALARETQEWQRDDTFVRLVKEQFQREHPKQQPFGFFHCWKLLYCSTEFYSHAEPQEEEEEANIASLTTNVSSAETGKMTNTARYVKASAPSRSTKKSQNAKNRHSGYLGEDIDTVRRLRTPTSSDGEGDMDLAYGRRLMPGSAEADNMPNAQSIAKAGTSFAHQFQPTTAQQHARVSTVTPVSECRGHERGHSKQEHFSALPPQYLGFITAPQHKNPERPLQRPTNWTLTNSGNVKKTGLQQQLPNSETRDHQGCGSQTYRPRQPSVGNKENRLPTNEDYGPNSSTLGDSASSNPQTASNSNGSYTQLYAEDAAQAPSSSYYGRLEKHLLSIADSKRKSLVLKLLTTNINVLPEENRYILEQMKREAMDHLGFQPLHKCQRHV